MVQTVLALTAKRFDSMLYICIFLTLYTNIYNYICNNRAHRSIILFLSHSLMLTVFLGIIIVLTSTRFDRMVFPALTIVSCWLIQLSMDAELNRMF